MTRAGAALLLCLAGCTSQAQSTGEAEFPAWIGLYDAELLQWLENENRLDELCGPPASTDAIDCIRDLTAPAARQWVVRARPSEDAAILGWLTVVGVPGRGLFAFWTPSPEVDPDAQPVRFDPDVYDADWGYGPYFHQSFSARAGDWFLLPRDPLPAPGWLRAEARTEDRVLRVAAGNILESRDGRSWVVLRASEEGIVARPEQPLDMWCSADEVPPLRPYVATTFTPDGLRDAAGHYTWRPKYTRGC